jgi:nitrate reductase delta subunit
MPSAPGKAREESAVPLHWVDFQQEGQAAVPATEVGNV